MIYLRFHKCFTAQQPDGVKIDKNYTNLSGLDIGSLFTLSSALMISIKKTTHIKLTHNNAPLQTGKSSYCLSKYTHRFFSLVSVEVKVST